MLISTFLSCDEMKSYDLDTQRKQFVDSVDHHMDLHKAPPDLDPGSAEVEGQG